MYNMYNIQIFNVTASFIKQDIVMKMVKTDGSYSHNGVILGVSILVFLFFLVFASVLALPIPPSPPSHPSCLVLFPLSFLFCFL